MKLNRIFLYGSIVLAGMLASCSSDDYEKGEVAAGNQLYAVTFGEDNIVSMELDPAEPTSYSITVYRDEAKSTDALSVPLKVLTNEEDIFTVPASVNFAAGSSEAEVEVTFNKAEVGVSYALEVALDESYVNPYKSSTTTSYAFEVNRVKWNSLGVGYWFDGWWGDIFEVEIFQRDDKPLMYRCTSPIDDDYVLQYTEAGYPYEPGAKTPYLVFTTTKEDEVLWDDYFLFNSVYSGYGDIWGAYDESVAENNVVVRNAEGGIQYLQINPAYYLPSIEYVFGNEDLCYLIFPGQDLPEALQEDEEGGDEDEEVEGDDEGDDEDEEGGDDEEGDDEEEGGEAAAPVRKAYARSYRLHR